MSFSTDVKNELAQTISSACCYKAEAFGMLIFGRAFCITEISLLTELKSIAERYCACVRDLTGVTPTVKKSDAGNYKINIPDKNDRVKILNYFGYTGKELALRINLGNLDQANNDCCSRAFLRGAFLSCASAVSPESSYHLEFVVSRFNLSRELLLLLKKIGYDGKYTKRNSHYIIYFKESEAIVDIIALIGAVTCSFDMTNLIIEKNIRNNCNRVANCEAANIQRTVATANRQKEAIRGIYDHGLTGLLSPELRETAQLRIDNPDMSLIELAEIHVPPVSKSCVNHRLKKLCEIWDNEKNNT